MAWVRFDDGFFRHPKVVAAGRDARDMYTSSIFYANQNLTDGFVPEGALRIIAADAGVSSHNKAVKALLREGLWIEANGGYEIHDYLDYQVSAASVTEKQTANRRRQQDWRDRNRNAKDNAQRNAVTNAPVTGTDKDKYKDNSNPDGLVNPPAPPGGEPEAKPKAKKATQISETWMPSDGVRKWAEGEGFTKSDVDSQILRFVDHWRGNGKPRKDWDATFRNWMRNAKEWGHLNPKAPAEPSNQTESLIERAKRERAEYEQARSNRSDGNSEHRLAEGDHLGGTDSGIFLVPGRRTG